MRTTALLAVCTLAASATTAQPFEFVVSEYSLGGSELVRFGGAGEDSGLANWAVELGPSGDVYVIQDGLSAPSSNLGEVNRYTRAGTLVETTSFAALNSSDRRLTALDFDNAGNMYVSSANGIGPIGTDDTRGSIFRVDANTDVVTRLQPFGSSVEYNDIAISDNNRIYASSWRGAFTGDDQMLETNSAGANLNSFSNTGNSVYHLDLDIGPIGDKVVTLTRNNGDQSTGRGWRIFSPAGATTNIVNLGGIDDYSFVGLEVDNFDTLWTYNFATESVERYTLTGMLLQSHFIPEVNNFLTDFTMTPEGTAMFTYRAQVPAPATTISLLAAGVIAAKRRCS